MSEIKVTFETITPLWTGDAWGKNHTIRPSSIIGSLRFWFEVICYFAGITTNDDYKDGKLNGNITSEQFEKGFLELQNRNPDKNYDELVDIALTKLGVPLPARIFGCTGWKSLIGIKTIEPIEDYCFGNRLNLPERICVPKNNNDSIIKENNHCPKRSNKDYSVWYLAQPYFYGEFTIIFEIKNNKIKDTIFYLLLNFIENYGFLGGKWNIGYGRVRVLKIESNGKELNINCEKFRFSQFCEYKYEKDKIVSDDCYEDKGFNDIIDNKTNFEELENKNDKKILILKEQIDNENLKETIKKLIKIKSQKRTKYKNSKNNNELRHQLFGTVKKNENEKIKIPQGTKILPWIYEDNGILKGGFVSIAGVLNLGG